MIIIKFMNFYDGTKSTAESSCVTVCCMRYDVYKQSDKATITVHKDYFDGDGVEYRIAPDDHPVDVNDCGHYQVAYIENEIGKTIDKVGPFQAKLTEVA